MAKRSIKLLLVTTYDNYDERIQEVVEFYVHRTKKCPDADSKALDQRAKELLADIGYCLCRIAFPEDVKVKWLKKY